MALYAFLKAWNTVWFVFAAILLADIFKELAKELVESSSRYVYYIKISIDPLFAKRFNFFHSYFAFFTMFDDLSAAMKLSSSWLELSSSCSSYYKNSKKPTRKFGLSVSVFCSFFSLAYFSYTCFKVFFKRHFAWRLKQTFKFSGP